MQVLVNNGVKDNFATAMEYYKNYESSIYILKL